MSFADDFKDLMTDTVIVKPLSSRSAYGVPTYGSGTTYTARVVRMHKMVRDSQGHQVVSTAQAWIAGTPAISPQDQVALSDGTTPAIAAVERFQDEVGSSHTKVYFL